eukprot:GHUV01026943.1.p1 GENE.GHUV01026943.1~~GHUV01026943.1.p1  ORF type:complete len:204 (-),score=47.37 GHUV01026943.1:949-1560(-)
MAVGRQAQLPLSIGWCLSLLHARRGQQLVVTLLLWVWLMVAETAFQPICTAVYAAAMDACLSGTTKHPCLLVCVAILQLTDAGFAAVFSRTMPALQHITLAGCPAVTDGGMQLLTASCRRLGNISISSCRLLTDKTLKRLAHCEHLTVVSLRACRGFTAEGVLALAAAPQMKAVTATGCGNVQSSLCKNHRPGVKVKISDARA